MHALMLRPDDFFRAGDRNVLAMLKVSSLAHCCIKFAAVHELVRLRGGQIGEMWRVDHHVN